jgi:hypothetical protein
MTLKLNLEDAGAGFNPRADRALIKDGVIEESDKGYRLSDAAFLMLAECVVANQRTHGVNMHVDYPRAFVAMPFSEEWSDSVYKKMIEPAIKEDAGFECIRGDEPSRVGSLEDTIWKGIMHSGTSYPTLYPK